MLYILLQWGEGPHSPHHGEGLYKEHELPLGSNGPTTGQQSPWWFLGRGFDGGLHLLSV